MKDELYLRERKVISVSLITTQNYKYSRRLLTGDYINNLWNIDKMEYYSPLERSLLLYIRYIYTKEYRLDKSNCMRS